MGCKVDADQKKLRIDPTEAALYAACEDLRERLESKERENEHLWLELEKFLRVAPAAEEPDAAEAEEDEEPAAEFVPAPTAAC